MRGTRRTVRLLLLLVRLEGRRLRLLRLLRLRGSTSVICVPAEKRSDRVAGVVAERRDRRCGRVSRRGANGGLLLSRRKLLLLLRIRVERGRRNAIRRRLLLVVGEAETADLGRQLLLRARIVRGSRRTRTVGRSRSLRGLRDRLEALRRDGPDGGRELGRASTATAVDRLDV